jgi:hypothetical protein
MPQAPVSVTRAPHAASTSKTCGGVEWWQSSSWVRVHVPWSVLEKDKNPFSPKEHRWVEVRIEGNKLVVELVKNGTTYLIRELLLRDVAKEIDTYSISHVKYLIVELNKAQHELWPCLLRAPMISDEKSFLVDDATLAHWHGDEVQGKHQEILDKERWRLSYLLRVEVDSKLPIDQKLCSVSERIQGVLESLNPTMDELQMMLRDIVQMHRLTSTRLEEDEREEFRDEEVRLTAEELFKKSDQYRWPDPPTEMVHYLRLATIHHYHCESTRRLVEFYMNDGMEDIALYFVLRLALRCNDIWANSTIAGCKTGNCRVFRRTRRLQSISSSAPRRPGARMRWYPSPTSS